MICFEVVFVGSPRLNTATQSVAAMITADRSSVGRHSAWGRCWEDVHDKEVLKEALKQLVVVAPARYIPATLKADTRK